MLCQFWCRAAPYSEVSTSISRPFNRLITYLSHPSISRSINLTFRCAWCTWILVFIISICRVCLALSNCWSLCFGFCWIYVTMHTCLRVVPLSSIVGDKVTFVVALFNKAFKGRHTRLADAVIGRRSASTDMKWVDNPHKCSVQFVHHHVWEKCFCDSKAFDVVGRERHIVMMCS